MARDRTSGRIMAFHGEITAMKPSGPKHTQHLLHAFLSFLTAGIWIPAWIWRYVRNKKINNQNNLATGRSWNQTILLLRIVRGICGLMFGIQVIHLLQIPLAGIEGVLVTGNILALATIKLIALAVFGGAFFVLRRLINYLHTRSCGEPHPTLAVKKWAL